MCLGEGRVVVMVACFCGSVGVLMRSVWRSLGGGGCVCVCVCVCWSGWVCV